MRTSIESSVVVDDAREVIGATHTVLATGRCDWGYCDGPADVVIIAPCEVRGLCDRHAVWAATSLRESGVPYVVAVPGARVELAGGAS